MAELSEIPLEKLAERQQAALLRLHLVVTAQTHRMLTQYADGVKALLLDNAGEDGTLDAVKGFAVVAEAEQRWRETFQAWTALFQAARREAAAVPFGTLARQHQAMMETFERALEEEQGGSAPDFQPHVQAVLDAAGQRV
ncbi:MAG: hypothetical protein PVF45_02730, partial [Anaerolineae bacterium]